MHTNRHLSYRGHFTGGVFGFMKQVVSKINDCRIAKVIACCDTKPYQREVDFPDYKQGRKGDKDPEMIKMLVDSKRLVSDFLEVSGWETLAKKGLEADDFVAMSVDGYHDKYDKIYIMSTDSDLHQLLGYANVFMLKKQGPYGQAAFRKEYEGIEPEDWPWLTALAGSHNDVPGIRGVGEKTALKILRDCDQLEDCLAYKDGIHKDLILRNYDLSVLPYKDYRIRKSLNRRYVERDVLKFLTKYGINPPGYVIQTMRDVK